MRSRSQTVRDQHSRPRGDGVSRLDSLHEQAVLHAEVRCLVHALAPYRVLSRHALERAAKAEAWHEADFDRALQAAIDQGEIAELPLGFYALPHSDGVGGDGPNAA